jgi:hypothetical protein
MIVLAKRFAKLAHEIRPHATGHGACFATGEITLKGRRVGYAYRDHLRSSE